MTLPRVTRPRVLSFDLDDTLWPVAPVIAAAEAELWRWLASTHPRAAAAHSIETMRALRQRAAEDFPERGHDLTFLRRQALAGQFAAAGLSETLADDALEVFFSARNRVEFYADARPALERLQPRQPLYALSNGNADLERCGIGEFFAGHVTARSAGAAKPDLRIFAQLVALAGVAAADVLHIGDDPLADVVGARNAGMQVLWLNRDRREWPAHLGAAPPAVHSLDELT